MLILYLDYTSLASAVAAFRVRSIVDAGGTVGFRGVDVVGVDAVMPVTLDQLDEIDRSAGDARALGLVVGRPSVRPPTFTAHLVGELAETQGCGGAWSEAVFRAYWENDAPIGDLTCLVSLAVQIGLDPQMVRQTVADRTAHLALRQRMVADRGRGIGGVPLFELDGTFLPASVSDADLHLLASL